MRLVVGVLAVLVVAQGLLLLRMHQRLDTLIQRLDDTRTLHAFDLGDRPGTLMMLLAPDEIGYSGAELRALQADVDAWLQGFVAEHGIPAEQAELLAGVLGSYVASYADARMQAGMGAIQPQEQDQLLMGLHRRCDRTAQLLLGDELGTAFAQEFRVAWQGFVAGG